MHADQLGGHAALVLGACHLEGRYRQVRRARHQRQRRLGALPTHIRAMIKAVATARSIIRLACLSVHVLLVENKL